MMAPTDKREGEGKMCQSGASTGKVGPGMLEIGGVRDRLSAGNWRGSVWVVGCVFEEGQGGSRNELDITTFHKSERRCGQRTV